MWQLSPSWFEFQKRGVNAINLMLWVFFQTNPISLESLMKTVDPSQLTPDLEGSLQYDHSTWIELRCVSGNREAKNMSGFV